MNLKLNAKQVIILYNAMKLYIKKYARKNKLDLAKFSCLHSYFIYYNKYNAVKYIYKALKKAYKKIINGGLI